MSTRSDDSLPQGGAANGAESALSGLRINRSRASRARMGELVTTMAGTGARVPFRDTAHVAKEHGGAAANSPLKKVPPRAG